MNTGSELTIGQHCKNLKVIGNNFDQIITGFTEIIQNFFPLTPVDKTKSPNDPEQDNYIIPYLLTQENRLGNQVSNLREILNFFEKQFHGLNETEPTPTPTHTLQETSAKPRFSKF
jgi:hypothetical protein